MSLLIKGMDMPDLDENTERLWVPGWIEIGKDGKAVFCTGTHFDTNTIRSYPIEEVPTPHGDLIDRDALQQKADAEPCFWKGHIDEIMVREAPTIIEAEGKS